MKRWYKTLLILFAALTMGAFVYLGWAWFSNERSQLTDDLNRRARIIAKSLNRTFVKAIKQEASAHDIEVLESISEQGRTLGYFLCGVDGTPVLQTMIFEGVPYCEIIKTERGEKISQVENFGFERSAGSFVHIYSTPLLSKDKTVLGVAGIVHDASYIHDQMKTAFLWMTLSMALVALLISAATYFVSRLIFQRSVNEFISWVKEGNSVPKSVMSTLSLLKPVGREFTRLNAKLRSAQQTAQEVSQSKTDEELWTPVKLKAHVTSQIGEKKLIVVSNREPYIHTKEKGVVHVMHPASGLVTALDPVLKATSGLWIAHGSGNADQDVVDEENKVWVPEKAPIYQLKRVWLTKQEEEGYYYSFSNEVLWPLCHATHERPTFDDSAWTTYNRVNQKFCNCIAEEFSKKDSPHILIQDYHFSVLPKMIREKRNDAVIGLFWHIPWPILETFQICPWKREVLQGMLGANILGFHLSSYCNNFLNTVNALLPVRIDWDRQAIIHEGGTTYVKPFPISVQPWSERNLPEEATIQADTESWRQQLELGKTRLVVSVDRLDYTKGFSERLDAIKRFFENNPAYCGKITFVHLAAPSRTHIPRYREFDDRIEKKVDDINWTFGTEGWKPILFLKENHPPYKVYLFLRMAEVCLVSSLADGMNLVAKEFIAARENNDGVLILSEFAGAILELHDALCVNPYACQDFAETIRIALEMPHAQQVERMTRLKKQVLTNNVYKWASDLLTELTHPVHASQATATKTNLSKRS
ncbi:MAG: trehalose-6-phosphate synthase [Deltaproteobacteria bacterium]|nr:trehalose-6-phosphate synthase [Deltaproteobacteria bacterium]